MKAFANYKESAPQDPVLEHQKKMFVLTQRVFEEMSAWEKDAEKKEHLLSLLNNEASRTQLSVFVLLHMKLASDFMMGWTESLKDHEHDLLVLIQKHPYVACAIDFLETNFTIAGSDATLSEKEVEAWQRYAVQWFTTVRRYTPKMQGSA